MAQGKKEEAEEKKAQVTAGAQRLAQLRRRGGAASGEDHKNYDGDSQYNRCFCSYRQG